MRKRAKKELLKEVILTHTLKAFIYLHNKFLESFLNSFTEIKVFFYCHEY